MKTRTRTEMRLYQRERRARIKAEAAAKQSGQPRSIVPADTIAAKRKASLSPPRAALPVPRIAPLPPHAAPGHELVVYNSPPSMKADGGRPPGPPLDIVMTQQQLAHMAQNWQAKKAEADFWRRRAEAAEAAVT